MRIWTPGGGGKRGWKVNEPGALPVLPGEWVPPGSPAQPAGTRLPAVARRPGAGGLAVSLGDRGVWVLAPTETALANVRSRRSWTRAGRRTERVGDGMCWCDARRCLPIQTWPVRRPIAAGAAAQPQELAVHSFDPGQPVNAIDRGEHRGLGEEAKEIDDPLLQLLERLRPYFEMARAVRRVSRGMSPDAFPGGRTVRSLLEVRWMAPAPFIWITAFGDPARNRPGDLGRPRRGNRAAGPSPKPSAQADLRPASQAARGNATGWSR